jgi:hypothetical protein
MDGGPHQTFEKHLEPTLGIALASMLSEKGLPNQEGKMHVQVLKVPHCGSNRDVSRKSLPIVSANYYITNVMCDNLSFSTLKWKIESEHYKNRCITIIVTSEMPVIRKVLYDYEPKSSDSECLILGNRKNLAVKLK